jgi:hypothetical protein
MEGWVGLRAGLGDMGKLKFLTSNSDPSVVQRYRMPFSNGDVNLLQLSACVANNEVIGPRMLCT